MKKLLAVAVVIVMVFALASCGSGSSNGTSGSEGGASSPAPASDGGTGKIKIVFAHSSAEHGLMQDIMWDLKDYLETNTDDFEVEIFANSQLGGDVEVVESVQANTIQGWFGATSTCTNFMADTAVFELPFAFNNVDETIAICDPSSQLWSTLSDSFKDVGLHLLKLNPGGFRTTYSAKKPILAPQDLVGFKIRILENENYRMMWECVGAKPTVVAFSEVYTAVEQGLVEGFDNPPEVTYINGYCEIFPYATETCSISGGGVMVVSQKFYDSLTDGQRAEFDEGYAYALGKAADPKETLDYYIQASKDDFGTEMYYFTPEDVAYCRDLCKPVWDKIQGEVSPEVLNSFNESLAKIREEA
ncbi:MAG: TRAP transporter substrate-binding protein [Clostridiales Family XIII bacterium]|jgi:TRAP-type C4-dicarboxylate transport system substrate-binding protein|nr:TRAP transporter substrate-binding protein [Clostridiales Family XIII bacterium]